MQKWEYAMLSYHPGLGKPRTVVFSNGGGWDKLPKNLIEIIGMLGNEGWELVSDAPGENGVTMMFKKPSAG